MSDTSQPGGAPEQGIQGPDPAWRENNRVERWTKASADVPTTFDNDQILRAIAGYSREQAAAARTTANWVTFIGIVVAVQVFFVVLVVLGAITLETQTGF